MATADPRRTAGIIYVLPGYFETVGIRLAIGASPRSLVRRMTRQAVLPVAAGVVLGLVGTRWISGLARTQLFNVDTHDPMTLAAATVTRIVLDHGLHGLHGSFLTTDYTDYTDRS